MPKYIASYDLEDTNPSPYDAFIEAAEKKGWFPWVWSGTYQKWYRLPNTTLIGEFETRAKAVEALKAAHSKAQSVIRRPFKMSKWIVANYTAASFSSDETVEP